MSRKESLAFAGCFAVSSGLLIGCVPTFADDLSTVTAPRVLAIQSSPAEAAPGASVTLNALVAAPDGAMATLDWGLCTARKPLTELGPVNPDCLLPPGSDPDAGTLLGDGASLNATLPADGCQIFGPIRPPAVAGQAQGRPVDPDVTGGYYQPITANLRATNQVTLGAVRLTCPLTDATPAQLEAFDALYRPNQNPDFSALNLEQAGGAVTAIVDGGSASVRPGEAVQFQANWAECPTVSVCGDGICGENEDKSSCPADCATATGCTGAETYPVFDATAQQITTQRESIRISWYASGGTFQNAVTGREETETASDSENGWTAPSAPGTVQLWLVIRDARGGQSFRSFSVSVQP
ncbi:MAG TPA: hypothetical protein VK745_25465 [Polyangiaceae bacterium]|nr:hypothetical protein [Polyangiaceae bacterium]